MAKRCKTPLPFGSRPKWEEQNPKKGSWRVGDEKRHSGTYFKGRDYQRRKRKGKKNAKSKRMANLLARSS
ncbi:hypothetical protein NC651_013134 [Populus alba x Populus x berolinensis]|nr:hypothetical protein NC651_013134 [Populus alba x Populus x berolinensis]